MELFSFPRTISEWWEMEEGIANANALSSSNAVQVAKLTSTNLLIQKSTLELAHKYDLSTNALAEATARLSIVEAKQTDRHISQTQRNLILALLKNAPRGPLAKACVGDDPEAEAFFRELLNILNAAGYPHSETATMVGGIPRRGLHLSVGDTNNMPPHASSLFFALRIADTNLMVWQQGNLPSDTVRLTVYRK